jgi:hypothetical protein
MYAAVPVRVHPTPGVRAEHGRTMPEKRIAAMALSLMAVLAACDSGVEPPPPSAASAEAITPAVFEGTVGESAHVAVIVRDERGQPIAGATVDFQIARGTGSVESALVITDHEGIARTTWNLGTVEAPGPSHPHPAILWATVRGAPRLVRAAFQASVLPGPPAQAAWSMSVPGVLLAGDTLEIGLRVHDEYANTLRDPPVTFAIGEGGGTLAGLPTNDIARIKRVAWTLGAGVNQLEAHVEGLTPLVLQLFAHTRDEFTWYDLQEIEGCLAENAPGSAIGLHENDSFLMDVAWPSEPFHVRGTYTNANGSLSITSVYGSWFGTLSGELLVLDLGDCGGSGAPANWIYKRRAEAAAALR